MSSEGENNSTDTGTAVAWDPKSPMTLVDVTGRGHDVTIRRTYAENGVGCNKFETSALMKLLDARDEYLNKDPDAVGTYAVLQKLCQDYCRALSECSVEWTEYRAAKEEEAAAEGMDVEDVDKESSTSAEGLELLKLLYALTQLSGTFLLLPGKRGPRDFVGAGSNGLDMYEDKMSLPGAVTADTVRFLRRHALGSAEDLEDYDPAQVEQMEEALQPDQFNGGDIYWKIVEGHMIRGCLEDAWDMLSNHSMLKRAHENQNDQEDDYRTASLAEDRVGFLVLRNILLSAPIPGGRNSDFDAGFLEDASAEKEQMVDAELIEGIPISAYRLWDTTETDHSFSQYPVHFEPHAANQLWESWRQTIKLSPELRRLRNRIPQLNRLMDLLSGDFRHIEFAKWSEELCCELLYKKPGILLVDMYAKTERAMRADENEAKTGLEEGVVSIMSGNAGSLIALVHQLGGGSGAGLPAVMTSLLCQLFFDAGAFNEMESDSLLAAHTMHATSAIISSLAVEGANDLGVRLAVRLVLPLIKIGSDIQYTAALANTLEHLAPQSDSEAKVLLSLCRKLVERKNVRVLDGCVSICLARYIHYKKYERPGGAMYWLLTGIEMESVVFCDGPKRSGSWQNALASGVCYRKLVTEFTETAQSMLAFLIGADGEAGASIVYTRAKEMIKAQEESTFAPFIPAVKVLGHVATMAAAILDRNSGVVPAKKAHEIVANAIVACLEERPNDEDDGVVSSLARPPMRWDLLRLAKTILDFDSTTGDTQPVSSFDVKGMGVLLSTFTVATKAAEMAGDLMVLSSVDEYDMRLALADGLKRAFVAENATKKSALTRRSKLSVEGIYGANFARHTREEQEEVVKNMLEI